ncbi:16S rRNA (uracil(1498)-N(3))-methyltransferase [Williamsia deligens]|uniref:Ribosomal RNA small subunit methyltransferase E n=1 Tax=Williamsia deligens TaxID=321325 RepID=A0ABW3G924_9NOCA|nr:16S rRNA (uracil(1498)-N(3))-methyltransferase [Williamsia deligens]MCP2195719.1 16S rRNA (uracil1498-N3)-methyltransferase [Williamsia deligens]
MTPPLFWVEEVPAVGALADLGGTEGHHAVTVTRIVAGDRITVSDGVGTIAECDVDTTLAKDRLRYRVVSRRAVPQPEPPVTLVQALPKSDRSELTVELATEAGVDRIVAWQSARCVSRWVGSRAEKGIRKWSATAATAAKQSRRPRIPVVDGPVATSEVRGIVADVVGAGGVALVLHESAPADLADLPLGDATGIVLVVGPEGGLDPGELDDLVALGARAVRMGPEVLRTSTAAAVALGAIGVRTRRWSSAR